MFIISIPPNLALGIVFSTRENAEITAARLGLNDYEIIQTFTVGEEVFFWDAKTGQRTLGTVREVVDDNQRDYMVDLDDGSTVLAGHLRLTPTIVG